MPKLKVVKEAYHEGELAVAYFDDQPAVVDRNRK